MHGSGKYENAVWLIPPWPRDTLPGLIAASAFVPLRRPMNALSMFLGSDRLQRKLYFIALLSIITDVLFKLCFKDRFPQPSEPGFCMASRNSSKARHKR